MKSSFVRMESNRPVIHFGALRHPVSIYRQDSISSPVSYDEGGAVLPWVLFRETHAGIEAALDARSQTQSDEGQNTAYTYFTITIRYLPGIVNGMRIQSGSSQYVIRAIDNVSSLNKALILSCEGVEGNL